MGEGRDGETSDYSATGGLATGGGKEGDDKIQREKKRGTAQGGKEQWVDLSPARTHWKKRESVQQMQRRKMGKEEKKAKRNKRGRRSRGKREVVFQSNLLPRRPDPDSSDDGGEKIMYMHPHPARLKTFRSAPQAAAFPSLRPSPVGKNVINEGSSPNQSKTQTIRHQKAWCSTTTATVQLPICQLNAQRDRGGG